MSNPDDPGPLGRRIWRKMLAEKASETAREWAMNGLDAYRGQMVPVTDPAAIAALHRIYASVLRRGGLDCVERIDPQTAKAFPSQQDFVKPSPLFAYLGHCFTTGDHSMGIEDFDRERMEVRAWLAAGTDPQGHCRFFVLMRYGGKGPEVEWNGKRDALRMLAFNTLDRGTQAAFHHHNTPPEQE